MNPNGIRTEDARNGRGVRPSRARARSTSTSTTTSTTGTPRPKVASIVTQVTREARPTKWCTRCERDLPRIEFYARAKSPDGLQSCCIRCRKLYNEENARAIAERHREYLVRTGRTDPEGRPRQLHDSGVGPAPKVLRRYGITDGDYETMLLAQGFRCAICFHPPPDGRRLAIDHCHETGKVRGLLCTSCNLGLGRFHDDRARLMAALEYLGWSEQRWMPASRDMSEVVST